MLLCDDMYLVQWSLMGWVCDSMIDSMWCDLDPVVQYFEIYT